MIFYDCSTAPSPRRTRIWLTEKNAAHEVVNIDLSKAEQMSEEFRKINPACTVPVLVTDDGTTLTQNAGIAAYLEAAFPEPPLLGRTPEEKGLVAGWSAKIEMDGLLAIAEALRNSSPYMKDRALTGDKNYAQIPALAERGLARVNDFFEKLEAHLEGKEFIVTDIFTNADILAGIAVDFARIVKVKPQEHHKNIKRWREGLAQRPSMSL